MAEKVKPVPEGYHTITPSLVVKDGTRAIEFYQMAFGAKLTSPRMDAPDGSLMHAELRIGDSAIMLGQDMGGHPGHEENCAKTPSDLNGVSNSFYLYVEDCDTFFKRAISAGAESLHPLTDMFWGDRMGLLRDPFGYLWNVASRVKVVTPEQMREGAKEFYAKAAVN